MCDVMLLSVAQIRGLARIVGPQVPETVHGIVSEAFSPTAWVLGPSGLGFWVTFSTSSTDQRSKLQQCQQRDHRRWCRKCSSIPSISLVDQYDIIRLWSAAVFNISERRSARSDPVLENLKPFSIGALFLVCNACRKEP